MVNFDPILDRNIFKKSAGLSNRQLFKQIGLLWSVKLNLSYFKNKTEQNIVFHYIFDTIKVSQNKSFHLNSILLQHFPQSQSSWNVLYEHYIWKRNLLKHRIFNGFTMQFLLKSILYIYIFCTLVTLCKSFSSLE